MDYELYTFAAIVLGIFYLNGRISHLEKRSKLYFVVTLHLETRERDPEHKDAPFKSTILIRNCDLPAVPVLGTWIEQDELTIGKVETIKFSDGIIYVETKWDTFSLEDPVSEFEGELKALKKCGWREIT